MTKEPVTAPDNGAPAPALHLDNQVCFALYAASRAATAVYRPHLDALGLTYPQYLVLLALWERGPVPVKELATALHLEYGTLSPLLKRLEALGHIRRERRPEDERSVLIAPTTQGVALRERARHIPDTLLEASGLTPEAARRLRRELCELADRLTETANAAASRP